MAWRQFGNRKSEKSAGMNPAAEARIYVYTGLARRWKAMKD